MSSTKLKSREGFKLQLSIVNSSTCQLKQLVVVREVMSAVRMVTTISTMRFKVFLVVSVMMMGDPPLTPLVGGSRMSYYWGQVFVFKVNN